MSVLLAEWLVAYLLGSVSGSLLLGRWRGVDIRTQGSGNAGGTNALRTQGWRFALGVVVIDIGKGALAASLGYLEPHASPLAPLSQALACGLAAATGHIWPVFHGFRGGKGAATMVGACVVALPASLAPLLGVWLLTLGFGGYVGLATVIAALALPLVVLLAVPAPVPGAAQGLALAFTLLILWTHRANLARLRAGTEHRFERARVLARWFGLAPRR